MLLLSALLFSLSSNLDNLVIGISYGIKDVKISILPNIIIGVLTTLGTFVSMVLGKYVAKFLPSSFANLLGAIVIILMGLYFIFVSIRENTSKNKIKDSKMNNINHKQKKISLKDTIFLSFALASNNLGVGVAASVTGLSIKWVCIFTFLTSLLTIFIGQEIGDHIIGKIIGKYDNLISGLLLLILGIIELL